MYLQKLSECDLNTDSKDHVANMVPTWALSVPGGSHVGPMYLAIRESETSTNLIL